MRKLLALVAVFAVAQGAHAESNMSTSAELRVRAQNDMNASGSEDTGLTTNQWTQRLKLGLDFNAGEKFSAHATLLQNNVWGQTITGAANDPTGDTAKAVNDGIGTAENMLLVNEAYGTWMMSDSASLRFGRGSFELASGAVVATNDWFNTPYAFDGVLYTRDMEFGRISGFYVKFTDWDNSGQGPTAVPPVASISAGADDAETNAYGLSLDVKSVPDMLKTLNFHIIQISKDELLPAAGVQASESSMRFGFTVAGETAGVDFRADYSSVSGTNSTQWADGNTTADQDIGANMMDIEVGYTLADVMGLRFFLNYHSDTGTCGVAGCTDDEQYDSFYYDANKFGGPMNVYEWGNLTYMHFGASLMPMDNMTVGFDYLTFSQTEKSGGNAAGMNGAAFGTTAVGGPAYDANEDALGTEMDLWVKKKYDNGFSITARYSSFSPGDEYKNEVVPLEDAYTQLFLEGMMTF